MTEFKTLSGLRKALERVERADGLLGSLDVQKTLAAGVIACIDEIETLRAINVEELVHINDVSGSEELKE